MKIILSTLLVIFGTACSSFTKVEKQSQNLQQVKKVAVVGYSVIQRQPQGLMENVANAVKGTSTFGGDINGGGNSDMDGLYRDFLKQLQKETGWSVMSAQDLASQPAYKKLVQDLTTGVIMRGPLTTGSTLYRPNSILDGEAFANIKPEQKASLVKALGVDAVIVVRIVSSVEKEGWMKYVGFPDYRSKAQIVVEAIDARSEKPVWADSWAWGASDQTLPSSFGSVDSQKLMEQSKVAVHDGYRDLFERYKKE